jgi:hypothetical protein
VIGGLIMSTMLSLVFVPAVFTVMDDIGRLTWRLFSGLLGQSDEHAHHEHAPGRAKPAAPAPARKARPAKDATVPAE